MSEIENEIREEAGAVAADIAAPVAAIVAEHAASEAAADAVEEAVERVEQLAEHVEEIIENNEEEAQWQRWQNELLESERRVVTQVQAANTELLIAAGLLDPAALTPEPEPEPMTPPSLSSSEAETEAGEVEEASMDPLAVAPAAEPGKAGRRRVRGLRR